ncbi:hypothetical protein roselon_02654 [Roseibacterium elongatum DSM 19469]|uniref:DoxX family protein n=1 Tax=Roseicyclus elongatus DSM 19469 TaxID=1294273 RepID=W8RUU5_9RHOB|nr:DoxX family protein [Roseibacterium elongatum]AHM04964.1 hypothetical protein roselon_02654 [Roseibacterium elongatum DSM 19469]
MRMLDALASRFDAALALVARVLMASLFLMAGISQIGDVRGFTERLAADGVPIVVGGLVFWVLILGGLLLAMGWATRAVALALGGFCLVSALLAYSDFEQATDMTMLLKNIALAGGFGFVFLHGPGAWSIDRAIARPSAD